MSGHPGGLGEVIGAALQQPRPERSAAASELHARLTGAVLPDGRAVTPHTIGALMAEYADDIASEYGGNL